MNWYSFKKEDWFGFKKTHWYAFKIFDPTTDISIYSFLKNYVYGNDNTLGFVPKSNPDTISNDLEVHYQDSIEDGIETVPNKDDLKTSIKVDYIELTTGLTK